MAAMALPVALAECAVLWSRVCSCNAKAAGRLAQRSRLKAVDLGLPEAAPPTINAHRGCRASFCSKSNARAAAAACGKCVGCTDDRSAYEASAERITR